MALQIYLVEDNERIRADLTEALSELVDSNIVGSAPGASAALEWLSSNPSLWQVAVVDMFLLEGSGLTVLAGCRQRLSTQRAIVLSNYATREMRNQCAALGADAVFDKSTELEEFLDYCKDLSRY